MNNSLVVYLGIKWEEYSTEHYWTNSDKCLLIRDIMGSFSEYLG